MGPGAPHGGDAGALEVAEGGDVDGGAEDGRPLRLRLEDDDAGAGGRATEEGGVLGREREDVAPPPKKLDRGEYTQ